MKAHNIVFLAAVCLLPLDSQALLFSPVLSLPNKNQTKSNHAQIEKCADFTGRWQGTCSQTNPDGTTNSYSDFREFFQPDCGKIGPGSGAGPSRVFEVGGIVAETHPDRAYTVAMIWNEDATVLKIIGMKISTSLSLYSESATEEMKLENGKLIYQYVDSRRVKEQLQLCPAKVRLDFV